MDWQLSDDWTVSFNTFMSEYDDLFLRSETREKAILYVRGLLTDVQRKNSWQLAEAVGLRDPHPLQRLLNEAKWDADAVQARQRQRVMSQMSAMGVFVVDESAYVKKGISSAGVKRQYCGRLGKVGNCQVGVYLTYATPTGTAFIDRRLYVPKEWCADEQRRHEVAIPDEITFQTKPQLVQAMLQQAWDEGATTSYVTGDSLYGNSPSLRQFIAETGHVYVLGIGSQHHVEVNGVRQALHTLPSDIPLSEWEQLAITLAETGLVWYEWTALRITLAQADVEDQWLLIRRTLDPTPKHDFFVSNALDDTPLTELVALASMRHDIEQALEEAKGQLGLADYEVRTWHGWHRHMTLCFLAHTWLALLSMSQREKKLWWQNKLVKALF